ncbi:MAG: cytochrome c oxidase assembly protein [Hyphomonadaceae bacterium]|nr:cytochrome c oxidase assembly protein [Hyphomonadaceae bacterium]
MTRNLRTALLFVGIPLVMLGLSFASKPLYDTFCRVTGFGGTTRIAEAAPSDVLDRAVTIRFDANVNGAPLRFRPLERSHEIRLGEHGLAFYEATNTSDHPISVIASYNVTPHRAGPYFNKLECFCFEERVIGPGETKTLPVVFFVDPYMDEKPLMDDVRTITLSYTFFEAADWPGASNGASLD